MTFGPRMRKRRLQLGWSQVELSRRTGIPTTRLSEFENGGRTDMTPIRRFRMSFFMSFGKANEPRRARRLY